MAGEMLEFTHGVFGIALNLEEESVGAVLLGDYQEIKEGDIVKRTGRIISVPVGDEMLGRVVNALGAADRRQGPHHLEAVFADRAYRARGRRIGRAVKEPLQTGLKAIDAMVPIGRGQRELIIGDRQTGKTAVAIDAILNQQETGVICIYNAIGQKQSTIAQVVRTLEEADAMRYTDRRRRRRRGPGAAALHQSLLGVHDRRVLPRFRTSCAHHLRRSLEARAGLSRDFAAAAAPAGPRGVSGRRVLPALAPARARGEVEQRARRRQPHGAADHRDAGGRSLRVHSRRTSSRSPTGRSSSNRICSIRAFGRPSTSATRCRASADRRRSRRCGRWPARSGSTSPSIASWPAFAQFGSDLDKSTQAQLTRGARLVEILKQPQYEPLQVERQVAIIFAGTNGYLDTIATSDLRAFEVELYSTSRRVPAEILKTIAEKKVFDDALKASLNGAVKEFAADFAARKSAAA